MTDKDLTEIIRAAIDVALRKAIEDEIEGVHRRVVERVRSEVGRIATTLSRHTDIGCLGETLRITVNFGAIDYTPTTTDPAAPYGKRRG